MDVKNKQGKYVKRTDYGWERYTHLKWPHQYFHRINIPSDILFIFGFFTFMIGWLIFCILKIFGVL